MDNAWTDGRRGEEGGELTRRTDADGPPLDPPLHPILDAIVRAKRVAPHSNAMAGTSGVGCLEALAVAMVGVSSGRSKTRELAFPPLLGHPQRRHPRQADFVALSPLDLLECSGRARLVVCVVREVRSGSVGRCTRRALSSNELLIRPRPPPRPHRSLQARRHPHHRSRRQMGRVCFQC